MGQTDRWINNSAAKKDVWEIELRSFPAKRNVRPIPVTKSEKFILLCCITVVKEPNFVRTASKHINT